MADEKIINRIKKMMALANDPGATDGERDTALRMSYSLLAKHNIQMADVQGQATAPQEARCNAHSEFYGRPWALTVCMAVAKLFFCKYFTRTTQTRNVLSHNFVGKESNAQSAEEVARVLVESIKREAGIQMRARGENATWRRSFATGAAFKIQERINALMTDNGLEHGSKGTLMLIDLRKTEQVSNELFITKSLGVQLKLRASKASSNLKSDAYGQGRAFGQNLNLSATKKIS